MAFAKKNQGAAPAPSSPSAPKAAPAATPTQVNPTEEMMHAGFVFDPAHFPFTLLELLTNIAKEIRELGLAKTGGKNSEDRELAAKAKYAYFEEAEIASHLVALLNAHKIGYAAGTPAITGRFNAGQNTYGGAIWSIHVKSAAIFSHAESKEWIIVPGVGESFDSGDKSTTKAITSAIKYIWMKTFLISDGNDIEVEQGAEPGENNLKQPTQSKSRTASLKCADCSNPIKGGKVNGNQVDGPTFAKATNNNFGRNLCSDCAHKAYVKSKEEPPKKSTPPAKATPSKAAPAPKKKATEDNEVDPDAGKIMELTLVDVKSRTIKKGTPAEKTIRDLVFHGGLKVTDWHESHYPIYDELDFKEYEYPSIIVYDAKQNGEYVNRDLKALMALDGNRYENQDGTDYEPEEASAPSGAVTDDNPITDDDIPF